MPPRPQVPVPTDPVSPAPAGGTGVAPRSWRKRHPVLARLVLYGVLLSVLVVPAILWVLARRDFLWARVEAITVEVQVDPTGASALASLDAEFSEWGFLPNPALTDPLRSRAERLRGICQRLKGDLAAMDRAFGRARELDPTPATVEATTLEWVSCRLALKDLAGAHLLLKDAADPTDPVLALWRLYLGAQVYEASGEVERGRRALRARLDMIPRPFDPWPARWFMLREWRAEEVAIEVVRWLVQGLPPHSEAATSIWQRLPELCPNFAGALLEAAQGMLEAGDLDAAKGVWKRLKTLDSAFAAASAKKRPALAALDQS